MLVSRLDDAHVALLGRMRKGCASIAIANLFNADVRGLVWVSVKTDIERRCIEIAFSVCALPTRDKPGDRPDNITMTTSSAIH